MSDPLSIEVMAHHEAGHAVAAYLCGWKITLISIHPEVDRMAPAQTHLEYDGDEINLVAPIDERGQEILTCRIKILMAGGIEERRCAGQCTNLMDLHTAFMTAEAIVEKDQAGDFIARLEDEIKVELDMPSARRAVDSLAAILIERRKIDGEEVTTIIRNAMVDGA